MVSDKVIVVLLIVAIILSLVSTIVTLSLNIEGLKLGGGGNTIIYNPQPEEENGRVAIVVEEPRP